MSSKEHVRIFADFSNADRHGRVRLNTKGTKDDLQALDVHLYEGLNVILYDNDEFVADAIVKHSDTDGWVAVIDWTALKKA